MPCFKTFHWPGVVSGCLAVTLAGGLSSSRVCAQDDTSRDQVETPLNDLPQTDERISDDIEVDAVEPLDRGPIHEAFAEPVVLDIEETIVVPKAPPETIEELPPEVKPDGQNVIWIPGYWHWLDDDEDFEDDEALDEDFNEPADDVHAQDYVDPDDFDDDDEEYEDEPEPYADEPDDEAWSDDEDLDSW